MRICITRSERYAYSETFIRDQITRLSETDEVYPIHSGRLPEREENGKLLSPILYRVIHKLIRVITGKRNTYFSHYGLKRFFKENKIDVVLANYGIAAAHLMPVCKSINLPLVVIFHGHDATDRKLVHAYTNLYKNLFANCSGIVAVSTDMRDKLINLGADASKISVIACGVNIQKTVPATRVQEKIFLAVGRFVEKKGPLFTLRAFHEVWKQYPESRLIMVGAHQGLYQKCVQLTQSLDMQEAVSFPGILTHEEVQQLMSTSFAFVQHSVTAPDGDMEGTPVSILEAAANGLPVISTLHGGIKDAVIHEQTGFLTTEGDVKSMATYMIELFENPTRARAMGNAGSNHVKLHYNQQSQINKVRDLMITALKPTNQ